MRKRAPGALGVAIALVVMGISLMPTAAYADNFTTTVTCTSVSDCGPSTTTPTPPANNSVNIVGGGSQAGGQIFLVTRSGTVNVTEVKATYSDGSTQTLADNESHLFLDATPARYVATLQISWNNNAPTTTSTSSTSSTSTTSTSSTSTTTTSTTAPPHRGPGNGPAAIRSDAVAREGSSPDATAVRGNNRLDVVIVDSSGNVHWTHEDHPFTNWTAYQNLGQPSSGPIKGNPSITSWGPGRLDVFARGTDDRLWQRFSNDGGQNWSEWLKPFGDDGVLASSPEAATRGPNRLNVFVVGTDGSLWERFYDSAWNHGWIWHSAPTPGVSGASATKSDPATVAWGASERVDLFVRGADDKLWQKFYDGAGWTAWFKPVGDLGTLGSEPDVASWEPGNLLVFVRGTNGLAYALPFGAGGWGPWVQLVLSTDVFTGGPGATSRGLDRFDLFIHKSDNRTYHIWQ
ncbi:MAG TPA: hypothetical protein VM263_03395 [Acidimicrobiales bacterium]|nr:hypothetical protein [Acidimicrobiales bacterium]